MSTTTITLSNSGSNTIVRNVRSIDVNQTKDECVWELQNREYTNAQAEQVSNASSTKNVAYMSQGHIQRGSVTDTDMSYRRFRIVEEYMIVWIDSNINKFDKDHQHSIAQLRSIVNTVETFVDVEECIGFLNVNKNEKVFLIISGAFGQLHASQFERMPQIIFMYVFCHHRWKHILWTIGYRKVKGVFIQIEPLCDTLKEDIRQCDQDLIPISIFSIEDLQDDKLNELDQSFMYSYVLKEILLEMKHDNKFKEDLVQFCRVQYSDNIKELKMIDEFEQNYDKPSPVWWYTRECFTYKMLNRALREQDVGIIIKMGFFVRDLHRQIQRLYSESHDQSLMIVYRGQGMSHAKFDKLRENIGGLLSFNEFLSTSIDKQVALKFAPRPQQNLDQTAILFQMEFDPLILSVPFAWLENISAIPKEKEILFSMHTVFRIGQVQQIETNLWQVNLFLTSKDNDKQSRVLTDHIRKAAQGSTWVHRLGQLMIEMGEFEKAEEVYKILFEKTAINDWEQLAHVHHQIGYIFKQKNDLIGAFNHYKQSLHIKLRILPSNDPQLASTYANIGGIFEQLGNLDAAMGYNERALYIAIHASNPNQLQIATFHNNIGGVLKKQNKCEEAFKQYEFSLNIRLAHLPLYHPLLAITYNNIGSVLYLMKDYTTALSYYQKALEINQKSLLPSHPARARSHHNMAKTLKDLGQFDKAIKHEKKARDIAPCISDSYLP